MRLLTKTNRYYLLSSVLVFLVGGLIFYLITQAIIREEVSEVLDFELQQKIEELGHQAEPPTEVSDTFNEIAVARAYGVPVDTARIDLVAPPSF